MNLFLSPHNDDEALFGAYTLMREHPLVVVVTDSYIQFNRGDGITRMQRRNESAEAMKLLGCPLIFGAIPDNELNLILAKRLLENFSGFDTVYAPAIQGGNTHHDLIGQAADQVFGDKVLHYATYTKTELWTTGTREIVPSEEEIWRKNRALDCYQSQILLPSTAPHFAAVRGRSEWLFEK